MSKRKLKPKSRTLQEALAAPPAADPLVKYYPIWYNNCLGSIKWLAGHDDGSPPRCEYDWQEIEWLVDYYEQQALVYLCEALKHEIVPHHSYVNNHRKQETFTNE